MADFAIIETGGKQYKIAPGVNIRVEKLAAQNGEAVVFPNVLLSVSGGKVQIGMPYLPKTQAEGTVLEQLRGEKKIIFRYHSKTRYRKKKGHRQPYTEVAITKI